MALGALFRAQVVTVAGALIWALFVENIIVVLKPSDRRLAAVHGVQPGERRRRWPAAARRRPRRDMLTRPQAFLVSIVYIAIVSVAAVFISLRRDVT